MSKLEDAKRYYKYIKENDIGLGSVIQNKETKILYVIKYEYLEYNSISYSIEAMSKDGIYKTLPIENMMQRFVKVDQRELNDVYSLLREDFRQRLKELATLELGKCFIYDKDRILVVTRVQDYSTLAVVIPKGSNTLGDMNVEIGVVYAPPWEFVKKYSPYKKRFTKEQVKLDLIKLRMLGLYVASDD